MFKLIIFNSQLKKLLFVSVMIAFSFTSNWTYQADLLNSKKTNNEDIKELIGNVVIEKDSTILMTKKALIFSDNEKWFLTEEGKASIDIVKNTPIAKELLDLKIGKHADNDDQFLGWA